MNTCLLRDDLTSASFNINHGSYSNRVAHYAFNIEVEAFGEQNKAKQNAETMMSGATVRDSAFTISSMYPTSARWGFTLLCFRRIAQTRCALQNERRNTRAVMKVRRESCFCGAPPSHVRMCLVFGECARLSCACSLQRLHD